MVKYFKNDELNKIKRLDSFENQCWVDLVNPTDDEIEDVAVITGIPEETLKAALDEEETARIERDDGYFMCLIDTPTITDTDEGDTYETIPMSIIQNEKCVVTVSLRGNPVLGDFISNRVSVDTSKPVLFMLTFMFGNAKRFLSNLRQIDKKSLRVQAELHRSMKNKELIQMLALENSLVYFSTSLSSNIGVYKKMEKLPEISGNEDYQDLYDDVLIETRQAVEMCNIYRDILSGTMDAYASVISNNLNVVMKLLAVITLILSVPTVIASLWGMNVGVPFEGKAWGFWVVIAISVVVTAVVSIFVIRMSNSIKIKTPKEIKRKRRRGD
ncbi:MAG: magnesium transporter CorA family protein [Clostridia bacterium]|nr:magnesium transporter CorA family protein [Clostridia bacterium]